MNKKIADKVNLADLPDHTALKRLASALWHQEVAYHGAAVMVGAGFSRSAAVTGDDSNKLPLWHDLSRILEEELGVSNHSDPLRLAEEYCAYFGNQALHDLIKREVNDAAWTTGELHKSLLELPWTEVLTTNWDTLLERASKEIHHPVYSIVSRQEDLSSARSPRIVKLHGTVNATEDLIFTQEDYRKYPQHHAAYVNFARQVFIENELCLLGFSGDDPNFLQWAGWVRDQLGMHTRRIYLVGALHLTAATRKYLESINVAPIDLGDLVSEFDDTDAKHFAATSIFLQALQDLKPNRNWEWSPTPQHRSTLTIEEFEKSNHNPGHAAILLERQIPILKADRESYPGWLVCPSSQRWELQTQISDPFPNRRNLAEMTSDSRVKLLYEIAWRHRVTYDPIAPWLAQELLAICDPDELCVLTKCQQMEVALLLLKNTRWFNDDESIFIERTTTEILERNAKYWPESANELVFHQAVMARDKFDYPVLETLTEKISEIDPVWKLRKASLLGELGQFNEGEKLIAEAYRELLMQHRNDRNSIYIFSRLAWAHWLLRGIESLKPGRTFKAFPSSYQESKCSPWDHIEYIQNQIHKALEKQHKQQEIEPSFKPGHYRDNSKALTFSSELHPIFLLEGISCSAGMPLRWSGINFLTEQASRLTELDEVDDTHRFALAIRAANSDASDPLKKAFSRIVVAKLSEKNVIYLLEHCIQAIEYWSTKYSKGNGGAKNYAIDRLRVFIEVLARVLVRATPEHAKLVFRLACTLGGKSEFHHVWLIDSLNHLIEYALESIPDSQQHELLPDALLFPLQRETKCTDHFEWPNPVISSPGHRGNNTALDRRIDEIIDNISPHSPQSASALLRLLPLLKNEFLTDDERWKIAEKLWGTSPDYQTLPEVGLLKYVLLELPAQDSSAVRLIVRRYLFEAEGNTLFNLERLMDIANVAHGQQPQELPSEDQATTYFDRLVSWRPIQNGNDLFGFSNQEAKRTGELIGEVLAQSVVPALPAQALTEENYQKLYTFYAEVESSSVIMAFPTFSVANALFDERVEKLIRQGLQEQDSTKVAYSSYAILKWRQLISSGATGRLILSLVYMTGISQMNGLAALLWTANQLYSKGYLSEGDTNSLIENLPVIFDNSDYKNFTNSSREAITVSLIRAACVRLARDILNVSKNKNTELLRILETAKQDALPEVRFAETTNS